MKRQNIEENNVKVTMYDSEVESVTSNYGRTNGTTTSTVLPGSQTPVGGDKNTKGKRH